MAKKRSSRSRRPSAPPRTVDPLAGLERVGRLLTGLHEQERQLLAHRDELVAQLRADGHAWDRLAAAAGTTRQALMKRR